MPFDDKNTGKNIFKYIKFPNVIDAKDATHVRIIYLRVLKNMSLCSGLKQSALSVFQIKILH